MTNSNVAGLAALDFDFSLSDTLKLTEHASAYVQSANTLTGLEASLSDGLAARLSYSLEHDTQPPAGSLQTDTLSRFTLIYGF